MLYQVSGFDTCTMYCAVTIDGELVWKRSDLRQHRE